MKINLENKSLVYRLKLLLKPEDMKSIWALLFLSIIVSVVEVVGITAIMPFVSLASDFSVMESNVYFSYIYTYFEFDSPLYFVMVFGIILILFYLSRSALNMWYVYLLAKFSEGQYYNLANTIYSKNVYMKNILFSKQNSASLSKTIITESNYLTQVITAMLFMTSEILIMLLLCFLLLYTNWQATITIFAILLTVVFFILRKISKFIKSEGVVRENVQNDLYKTLSSSFGNFKLIKLFGVEEEMMNNFSKITERYSKSNIIFLTFSHIPRLILDALGFSILILIVLILLYTYKSDIHTFLPMLTLYVVSLYRILPSLNRIVTNYNKITFYQKSLETIEEELKFEKEALGDKNLIYKDVIKFKDVCFSYKDSLVLENLSIAFKKDTNVAIIGESGSGKSTFIDLLMGLNSPDEGLIYIDDVALDNNNTGAWRKRIGYIPQDVYLFEGSVADNVVFGRDYDESKIKKVLEQACIYSFLLTKDGIETEVGEGGKLLSGGQKQRIAIARALYGDPEVLVLDEATSALDKETETEIMKEVYAFAENMTLFLITHNKKIAYECDKIYKIESRNMKEISV